MKNRKAFLFILLAVFIIVVFENIIIGRNSWAENYQIKAYFLTDSAQTGEIVTLRLDFIIPSACKPSPDLSLEGIEKFDVLSKRVVTGGIEIDLLVDQMDRLEIPSLTIICDDNNQKQVRLHSNPASIEVATTINGKPSAALLMPIKEIVSTSIFKKKQILIITATLLLIVLILAACFLYRRFKRNKSIKAEDAEPPHIKALRDIESLAERSLPDKDRIKQFYFRLSEILREYLGKVRTFDALEMTTNEISKFLTDKLDRRLVENLKKIDFIKFADYPTSNSIIKEDIRFAKEYVNLTTPVETINGTGKTKSV